jgi:hypothetical protein
VEQDISDVVLLEDGENGCHVDANEKNDDSHELADDLRT